MHRVAPRSVGGSEELFLENLDVLLREKEKLEVRA